MKSKFRRHKMPSKEEVYYEVIDKQGKKKMFLRTAKEMRALAINLEEESENLVSLLARAKVLIDLLKTYFVDYENVRREYDIAITEFIAEIWMELQE